MKKEVGDTTNEFILFIAEFLPYDLGFLHVLLVIHSLFPNMETKVLNE